MLDFDFKNTRIGMMHILKDDIIIKRTRREKDIIFGGQAIKQVINPLSRPTSDFDIFTKNPKASASALEKSLDSAVNFDYFYTKKGTNPGTWKVKAKGLDLRRGTKDDIGIVDYTKIPSPVPNFFTSRGVRYRKLSEELKAKKKIIKDPEFQFRKEKDLDDINRIKIFQNLKGGLR